MLARSSPATIAIPVKNTLIKRFKPSTVLSSSTNVKPLSPMLPGTNNVIPGKSIVIAGCLR
jgi:hypothetical protein